MEITINTTKGTQEQVEVIKSFYYTIAGKRVKFHIHKSLHLLGCYTIAHAKSKLKVRDYPKYGHGCYGLDFTEVAREMLKEVINKVGEEKMKAGLIKAGEIFK